MERKIDTLVIIGNGFDLWQGMRSGLADFAAYYRENRDKIMKKLHIKPYRYSKDGEEKTVGAAEIVYGDPLDPDELNDGFWSTFENSLDQVDTYALNLLFGKKNRQLKQLGKCVRNANRILREAFCGWVCSLKTPDGQVPYSFGENCFFINFNYTDTLARFGVPQEKIFHIHGEARDKRSVVFGHASHPYEPEWELYRFGGRFRGLFLAEYLLYMTDKRVDAHIMDLVFRLATEGVVAEDIKHVYVLGHSMSPPDVGYFDFLLDATRVPSAQNEDAPPPAPTASDGLEQLHLRIQYAIQRTGYGLSPEEIPEEQAAAVAEKAEAERLALLSEYDRAFKKMLGRGKKHSTVPPPPAPQRETDAKWHVSCHAERDKTQARELFSRLGFGNYQLYNGIDDCLAAFLTDGRTRKS